MSVIDFIEEFEKRIVTREYPKFRAIQGGKEPPTHNDYWLKNLEEHAVFIARDKSGPARWLASEYHIVVKVGDAFMVMLKQWDPEKGRERVHYSWIVGPDFCQGWDCIEVLNDGKGNWTDHEEGLEGDVGVPTDSTVDQDTGQEIISRESDAEPKNIK